MNESLQHLGHHASKYAPKELGVMDSLCESFMQSEVPVAQRLQTFPRHVRRQDVARFLVKHELFKLALPANGSVVECGVFAGGGLFSWLHFSSIYEPYNHTRRIVGFDTFTGFPTVDEKDLVEGKSEHTKVGAFQSSGSIVAELERLAAIHDNNRPIGHIPKIELVAGDACETIPRYLDTHPHLLIALLYLDFDLYAPTKVALNTLYSRVVKGGVIAFDELNCAEFAGETTALLEAWDLQNVQLQRFPTDPYVSYFLK
ncbi:MAG: TylF/MycF/NovP-related O-methyltransferase [Chthoniobacteraceae bacterium]